MLCDLVVVVFDETKRYIGCVYDDIAWSALSFLDTFFLIWKLENNPDWQECGTQCYQYIDEESRDTYEK